MFFVISLSLLAYEFRNFNILFNDIIIWGLMGLLKGDLEKVPKGLALKEYYKRIVDWYKENRDLILQKMHNRTLDDPYIRCFFELVENLPSPDDASPEDIALICIEVISGLMEWAYHEEDQYGVKMAAYAHYILNEFFDGFFGEKTRTSAKQSSLYQKYSMRKCLERH